MQHITNLVVNNAPLIACIISAVMFFTIDFSVPRWFDAITRLVTALLLLAYLLSR